MAIDPTCAPTSTPQVPATPCRRTSTPIGWHRRSWPARTARGASHDKDFGDQPVTGPCRDTKGLGWSRGSPTTQLHLVADAGGRPLAWVTSARQRHDSLGFEPVLARLPIVRRSRGRRRTRLGHVLADKAYSSRAIRAHLRRGNITATIPEPDDQIKNRTRRGGRPPAFARSAAQQRNTIERAINKLRQARAVATRYDKRAFVYRGTIDVTAIRSWLRAPVP